MAAAALVSLVGAGFSAQALSPAGRSVPAKTIATGYEADDHFPGAAYYTAVEDGELPTGGATGTTELPDLPIPAGAVVDSSIQPAPPFVLAGSETDKARALHCLTTAIYYEAASEPDDGQRAVAQVVLNRARHPAFPGTVCGVVFQGSSRPVCQFSFACDGSMARAPSRTHWARAQRVAASALAGSVFAPVGMATHYHTYAVTPSWNRSLVMTGVHGAHFFHRWKGWWGTAAAFSQRYRGGEPVPAPQPRAQPAPVPAAAATGPREAIQPAYRDSGAPRPAYAESAQVPEVAASDQLPESTILDKWKDTGKPLR